MLSCDSRIRPADVEFKDERSKLLLSSTRSAQALNTPKHQSVASARGSAGTTGRASARGSAGTRGRASSTVHTRLSNSKFANIIEPVIFLFLVAKALSDTIITNLLENRTCLVKFNFPDNNCTEPIAPTIENLIQPSTADVIMARSLVEAFIPAVLTLLVGPWSDINGRKPFLIIALAGQAFSYLTWASLSLVHGIPPPAFLFASLPVSLSGGSPIIYLLVYCYITDVTDDQNRPFRLSLLTFAIFTSSIMGIGFAPMIVSVQNTLNPYPLVFFISFFMMVVTVVYTIFFISETVVVRPDRNRCLFEFSHLRKMFLACFNKREGHARCMILTIIFALSFNVFVSEGEGAVLYLSAKEMFSWTLSNYTIYLCLSCIYGPGSVIGVWLFTSFLELSNIQAATLTLATRVVRSPIMALATASWHFYLANVLCFLSCAYAPLVRSELGRLAPKKDLGKIFALTAFLESITPVVATPLYTVVYTATFLHAPGTVYWLSSAITLATVLMLFSVAITQKLVNGACYADSNLANSNYVRILE